MRGRLSFENRLLLRALAVGLPGVLLGLILLWQGDFTETVRWLLAVIVVSLWLLLSVSLRQFVAWPLNTLSNILASIRDEDFSLRARGARHGDAFGEVFAEVNDLSDELRSRRLDSVEASALLGKIVAEIDVAVFAFDDAGALRVINQAGERLLGRPTGQLLGRRSAELGLDEWLEGEAPTVVERSFPGGSGKWEARLNHFRQEGRPFRLLVLSNVSRVLRREERLAWQRLIRVLGHELNNSLAPIQSIAESMESLLARKPLPEDWSEDLSRGFAVIRARSEALRRFTGAYSRLARLPMPEIGRVELAPLIDRIVGLETRMAVKVNPGPPVTVRADADQIEQLLINILRNAVDAALETGGAVEMSWRREGEYVDLVVADEGPGVSNRSNLFVPFFTTKPEGSGVGLVLSRQIAEAHGGSLAVENREPGPGCEARLKLPV